MQSMWKPPALFGRRLRRDRTHALSHGDPIFKIYYLGTEKIYSLDLQHAEEAISRVLEKFPTPKSLRKEHALVVRSRYLEVKELSSGRQLTKTYLKDIAYCASDARRPNVFLYICRQPGQQLQCRLFWCSRPERARDIAACLAMSFQRALSDSQGGEAGRRQGEGNTKDEQPITAKGKGMSSGPTADSGQGQWRRGSMNSHTSLRVMMRRASISD